jgi:hypothetical protein
MKNATYKILAIASLLFLSLYFFQNDTSSNTPNYSAFHSQQPQAYSKIQANQNDSVAGRYQTSNSVSGFKNLILDSTYTYSYKMYGSSGEEIILEGSWELSYKNQDQHIILHRPLPNKAAQHLKLANIEEHKLKVTSDGLRDLYTQEDYLQVETDEYSLAVFK